jgi:choline dehydrogenase-like flavoprotein
LNNCQHGEVFDAIVIGTGFAGGVTAARLVQAGQRICVLERGRRFEPDDFPMYPSSRRLQRIDGGGADEMEAPDLARWFWAIDQGLYDVRDLDDVIAVQAAGYGGGSLIYANVHLRAPAEVFEQGWPKVYRRKWLDRFYDLAACMLDVQPMPKRVAKTEQLQRAARDLDREGDWFRPPLAVNFGGKEQMKRGSKKPNRWGREQGQCDLRGQCWLGCREQAKNTLDRNYLAIVEDARDVRGPLADIRTLAEVCRIERVACGCGARFAVHYRDRLVATSGFAENGQEVCCARHVFLCAGAVNSTELLLRSADLLAPEIRRRVGSRYHPNADSIAAVFDCDQPQEADRGPTITSALLYHGRRPPADYGGSDAAPDRTDGELWALEFATDDRPDPGVKCRLKPGALISCGAAKLRLVEAPLFDFGSLVEPDSHGILVAAGDRAACREGESLFVGPKGWKRFGRMTADARPLEDWFLVEDGGYPTDIEPLLGVLRSPLWLRRNRYHWQDPPEPQQASAGGAAGAAIEAAARGRAGPAIQQARRVVDPGPAGASRFPLPTAVAALRGLPRRPIRISADLSTATPAPFSSALAGVQPLNLALDTLLPPWLRDALARDRTELAEAIAPLVGPFLETLFDDLAEQLNRRFDLKTLLDRFDGSVAGEIGMLTDDTKVTLIRGLLRQGIQVLWGSEVALAQRVNDLLLQRLPRDLQGWADMLAPLLGWLLQYRPGNGRTAVLLIMGRDRYRGRLELADPARPLTARLTARLPAPAADSTRLVHERLLRDIAATWHGELRTNPAWTFLKRRITVHSQGGCPMSSDESAEVTRANGEVIGCESLYVMDAAAFPTSVGVNPSATILAVAEYKVERFIKEVLHADPKREPTDEQVEDWLAKLKPDRAVLDPIPTNGRAGSAPLRAGPLGLTFEESISGLFDPAQDGDARIDWCTLSNFDPAKIASFETAERRASAESREPEDRLITMELTASIGDLDRFLQVQRQGLAEKVALEGTVKIRRQKYKVLSTKSYLQFFLCARTGNGEDRAPERFFRYRVAFACCGREMVIEAAKVLRDDPRFDVWYDLSTLYFDVFNGDPASDPPRWRGIMRLAPVDFVEKQLRSVAITPDDVDPSRKSWAYLAFVRYYAGEVAGVYLQRPHLARDFLRNVIDVPQGN